MALEQRHLIWRDRGAFECGRPEVGLSAIGEESMFDALLLSSNVLFQVARHSAGEGGDPCGHHLMLFIVEHRVRESSHRDLCYTPYLRHDPK